MTAQKGRDLLLKIDTDGAGTFITVAGLRTHALSFNAQSVEITHQESAGAWRELLGDAGVKSAGVTGAGIFRDAQSDETMRSYFFAGTIRDWQIVVPDFGVIEGPFQITALELTGRHDGEITFDLALESAGLLTFTPV